MKITHPESRTGAARAGFRLVRWELTEPLVPEFRPIQGLDTPQVVPFLVNVLDNGPDWTDPELLKNRGGMYPHIARCYAALCLGSIGDHRAYEPLVRTLQRGTFLEEKFEITYYRKEEYHMSDYAALALGYLGDPNAVEPLIDTLRKDEHGWAVFGLTRLHDVRSIKPIVEYASKQDIFNIGIHKCLEYICRARLRIKYSSKTRKYTVSDFNQLGELEAHEVYQKLWEHWLKEGDTFAKQLFEKYYPKYTLLRKLKPDDQASLNSSLRRMTRGGIPTLPYMINEIGKGDESLVSVVAALTDTKGLRVGGPGPGLPRNAKQAECMEWWSQNKQKWLIFDPNE